MKNKCNNLRKLSPKKCVNDIGNKGSVASKTSRNTVKLVDAGKGIQINKNITEVQKNENNSGQRLHEKVDIRTNTAQKMKVSIKDFFSK